MKFSAVTLACLASGVYADLPTIVGVVTTAGQDIQAIDQTVNSFSGDPKAFGAASAQLISDLNAGKAKVDASTALTLSDTLGLQQPVTDLQAKGQTLADDLHKQKPAIQKAGLCAVVAKQLGDINSASQALISSVVAKVPSDAQAIATSLASGLTTVLNKAQDDFSTTNCVNSGGSSSPPAGGSSSSSASSSASTNAAATTTSGTVVVSTSTISPKTTGTGSPTVGTTAPPAITAGAAMIAPAGAFVMAIVALIV
ncbi:Uncharacterized protein TCAP_05964 [Tolypocladium capitatum]|uniref:Cell wall protein n=1 Tax=Tolypocladium capitatum TaxID=45235 RepID=A0A2K3Q973_9HYPO|nr:Uncharacterized protein TCAP_05964 [Tolypocladium capitatum]